MHTNTTTGLSTTASPLFRKRCSRKFPVALIVFLLVGAAAPAWTRARGDTPQPRIEDYATIEAYVGEDEIPVYAFGHTYVYGVSPDLLPGMAMQKGNANPAVKFKPKKSWEIKENLCGSTPAREPKAAWNDDQPLLPIHLIDGDPETAWSSRGGGVPDRQPEWIRIDLPAENTAASVVLTCCEIGPLKSRGFGKGLKPGKSLPRQLTIKLSRDATQWETVYQTDDFRGSDSGSNVISFDPRRAKQIWIIGGDLQPVQSWGYAFSIGEVEVRDPEGNNLALVSRGAGVQVSSTHFGFGMDRYTQDMLWPIQYDLGFKWTRVGYDMGMYLWSYVEREKGKLQIDPKADAAVTEASRNGVNVILVLDKGNWLYHNPPRKVDWKKCRTREMMETYFDHQGWPTDSPEALEGYLRYVDYMVRHFKGRVAYYEVLNEWNNFLFPLGADGVEVDQYVTLFEKTASVIKKADPGAKVVLGSLGFSGTLELGYAGYIITNCLGPGCGVRDGELHAAGRTIVTADRSRLRDVRVTADARSKAQVGIVLRYKDPKNFLVAIYDPERERILFREIVDATYRNYMGLAGGYEEAVAARGLGADVHLEARIEGAEAILTVTGRGNSATGNHTVRVLTDPGASGLYHCPHRPLPMTTVGVFDNFTVTDLSGKETFRDGFDGPEGPARGWSILLNHWSRPGKKPLVELVDAVGWHPTAGAGDLSAYFESVRQLQADCESLGFKGAYGATETYWYAPYPPPARGSITEPPGGALTEMQKAKCAAQQLVGHSGLGVISLYNETFQTANDLDTTLLRNAFTVDPIIPAQPQPIYYVFRNISTVLDGFRSAHFPVVFGADTRFECYTFKRGRSELMIAAWIPGKTSSDGVVETVTDVTIPGIRARRAWAVDIFNGTEQELLVTHSGGDTVLKGMLIKDYAVHIRVSHDRRAGTRF